MKLLPITVSTLAATIAAKSFPGKPQTSANFNSCFDLASKSGENAFGPQVNSRLIVILDESDSAANAEGRLDYVETSYKWINSYGKNLSPGNMLTVIRAGDNGVGLSVENFPFSENANFDYQKMTSKGPIELQENSNSKLLDAYGCAMEVYGYAYGESDVYIQMLIGRGWNANKFNGNDVFKTWADFGDEPRGWGVDDRNPERQEPWN